MIGQADWYELKLFMEHATGVEMATLHVLVGVVIQFAVALILAAPVSRWSPWLAVLAFELFNEWNDLSIETWPHPGMQYGEGAKDLVLTMLIPTLILIASRFKPGLLVERPDGQQQENADTS